MHFLFKRYEKDEMTFLVEKNDIFRAGLQELPHEDIVFQLCWAYILPSSDYPLSLTDAVLEEIQVFLSEYNMALEGQLSETEYIENRLEFMNGIEKYCGDQALSRF